MKRKMVFGVVFVLLAGLFLACATGPYKPSNTSDNIIGTVQTSFEVFHYYGTDSSVNEAAYIALLEAAKKEYQGNIDIRDITWARGRKVKGYGMFETSATGKVVLLGGGSGGSTARGVEGALARAVNDVSKNFSSSARIAIVQITAPDRSTRDYMIGELEYILQQQGYYMVDRAQLDRIFEEQRFGATSDVDDNTAARMGHIAGASVVITGRVDGEGNLRRLRLRALNTETARVIGTASEKL